MQGHPRGEVDNLGKQEEHLTDPHREILQQGRVQGQELFLRHAGDRPGRHLQELRHAALNQLHGHDGGAGAGVSFPRL